MKTTTPGAVTAKDVAEAAAVSTVTVSRVLNNHGNVSEHARRRVLQVARELGYSVAKTRAGQSAQLNAGRALPVTHINIGFLFSLITRDNGAVDNPFWSRILHGVEQEAAKSGAVVSYRSLNQLAQRPEALLATVRDLRLDAMLLVGSAPAELATQLARLELPLVLVDNVVQGLAVDAVLSDNFFGAREAVEHLIARGRRRIAFIGAPLAPGSNGRLVNVSYTIEQRALGYRTALGDAGLAVEPALVASGDLTAEGGYAACNELLARAQPFDALFCANDDTAIGALKALSEAGRRVPADVSLVGFDDIDIAAHLVPALTTVHVDSEAMGAVAVKALLSRAADPTTPPVTSVLRVELIPRASV